MPLYGENMTNVPIVNAGLKYVNGLNLSNDAVAPDTIINIAAGSARDSTNVNDIVLAAAVDVDGGVVGAGGVDLAVIVLDSLYAVHVIGDSTKYKDAAGILSLDHDKPTLPRGYDMWRRVGSVLTDGAADWLLFDQRGMGSDREMWYRASVASDITAGASAAYAAVDISGSVPAQATDVNFACAFTPTAPNDELNLRNGDSAAAGDSQAVASGAVAAVVERTMLRCPCSATAASAVDYKVTGSAVALNVQSYVDQLA